jgi:hypothetical protein
MRLLNQETDKRIITRLDKTITVDNVRGIIKFGENNDYPNIIENIVSSSITAKSISKVYARFLFGQGFENEEINNIVVGQDSKYKDITLKRLLSSVSKSIALNNGSYLHLNFNRDREIVSANVVPFKYIRFQKQDDKGYNAKLLSHQNWAKDPDVKNNKDQSFNKTDIKVYDSYNVNPIVFNKLVGENIVTYKGQIYCLFLDDLYIYPLSPFDATYLDADTESQISIFKNRQIRNGLFDKTVFRVQSPADDDERAKLSYKITSFLGPDSDNVLLLEDEIDTQTGEIKKNGAFAIDSIPTNINDTLFEKWERSLQNNIRKSVGAVPEILIDYEAGKLGTTSGESFKTAVDFYNAMTIDDRSEIEAAFKEIFSNFANPILKNNANWKIKPVSLEFTQTQVIQ